MLILLAGCSAIDSFNRPDGDGGWSSDRRRGELEARAEAAQVDLAGAPKAAPASDRIDLPTALSLAAAHNLRIAESEKQLAIVGERVRDTRGRLLPSTTATARYSWYSSEQTTNVDLPRDALPPGFDPVVTVRAAEAGTVNATVAIPLDLSGELRRYLAAAQAGYRGERARLWATTLEQQTRAVRAYYQLLEAEKLLVVNEQRIALYRQQVADSQARVDAGRATKNDLLVAQVALQNVEQQRVRRALAIDQARWSLNEIIGAPVDAPTKVVDVTGRPDIPETATTLKLAYEHNPMLGSLVEEQQRLEETMTALKRSRLPRFSTGGGVDYTTSDIIQPQSIGTGYVGFAWDLGTDLRREAQIHEAEQAAEQNRLRIERDLRELEAAVRGARGALEERLAALAASENAVGQAEENLRIRRQQFDAGRATSDDVLLAESILSEQRATLASALYQAHTRRAELQELVGLPLQAAVETTVETADTNAPTPPR